MQAGVLHTVATDSEPSLSASCEVRDFTEWTLLGEYTGVWDSQENILQRIKDDPQGLGIMTRDKVTELAYTGQEASEDTQKVTPDSCRPVTR